MKRIRKKHHNINTSKAVVSLLLGLTSVTGILIELAKYIPDFDPPSWITYQNQDENNGRRFSSNTVGIVRGNGYNVETHYVITEDGFILELHRIPPISPSNLNPVLLMHGNFQSSADWVINSPANNSFAFILSDLGYDVWLGNHRGNTYSKRHSKFRLNSHQFWNFSFHEMGLYDFPAMVDYVLRQTGYSKLHYVCFSYSTTAFIAGLSLRPEYNRKITSGIVLGPSVYQANFLNGLVYYLSFSAKFVNGFIQTFGAIPILPNVLAKLINAFLPIFCNPKLDVIGICVNVLHVAFGDDGNLITKDQLPLITSVAPSSSGLKAWNHIVQMTGSLKFAQYDYGKNGNVERYGTKQPPTYNLSAVSAPIAIFVGGYDFLAHREDAKTLAAQLPNLLELYLVPYKQFCHLDFTYGRGVAADVYYHAIDIMRHQEF